jgi:ATP-dependent DNA helicase PIF1
MLVALLKLGAPLPLSGTQALTTLRLPLQRAHLPQLRLSTSTSLRRPSALTSRPRHYYDGYFPTRSYSDYEMFHQAVQRQSAGAAIPASSNPAYKQPTIATPYSRTGPTQKPTTRPIAFGSENISKQNAATTQRPPGQSAHGIKRTSGGLEKSLSQQFDDFDYPTLEVSELEKENSFSTYHTPAQGKSDLAAVLFDDNDFDSDIDLEAEDPATKATVTHPNPSPQNTVDSGYSSRPQSIQPKNIQPKAELDSSQPIPWSSSPAEHFKTPPKPAAKRRQLPWAQKQSKQVSPEPREESLSKRQKSTASTTTQASTPASKSFDKSDYMWNTTASAVKQQQKNFREQNKKTNQSTDADLQEVIRKKKKHSVARIFLSEEQQHVLNLVTEYKKSVFFTGSAGESHRLRVCAESLTRVRYW